MNDELSLQGGSVPRQYQKLEHLQSPCKLYKDQVFFKEEAPKIKYEQYLKSRSRSNRIGSPRVSDSNVEYALDIKHRNEQMRLEENRQIAMRIREATVETKIQRNRDKHAIAHHHPAETSQKWTRKQVKELEKKGDDLGKIYHGRILEWKQLRKNVEAERERQL